MQANIAEEAETESLLQNIKDDHKLLEQYEKGNIEQRKKFSYLDGILERSREQELVHNAQKSSLSEISGRIKKMIEIRKERMYLLKWYL